MAGEMDQMPQMGVGDYLEPFAHEILPGGTRKRPFKVTERGGTPPILQPGQPGQPGFKRPPNFTLNQQQLQNIILDTISLLREEEGLPTKEVTFDSAVAHGIVLGLVPVRVDVPVRRERRGVLLTNTDPAALVWYGYSNAVAVNNGGFLPAGGGSVSLPHSEIVHIWALSTVAGAVLSVQQFA